MSNKCILITGAHGFIGKNLTQRLKAEGYENLMLFDANSSDDELNEYAKKAEFVFHLAGVNRPKKTEEFYEGNANLTQKLLNLLLQNKNNAPVLLSSSTQAALDNDYGKSKKQAENLVFAHGESCGFPVFVFRLAGVFGKWCRPSYNSVVATFCHNIAHNLPIEIRDENYTFPLVYVDDVVNCFINALENESPVLKDEHNICKLNCDEYTVNLKQLADLIYSFKESRKNLSIANMQNAFEKKLYSTYLSYLPKDDFAYDLKMNCDDRGSFTEFLRTDERGQVSINVAKPGIVKGNHWHNTKNEKFLVVGGKAVIRFRKIGCDEITEYHVSADNLKVVDIPVGYTHNIENTGTEDLVTVMWVNEPFNPDIPDTIYEQV